MYTFVWLGSCHDKKLWVFGAIKMLVYKFFNFLQSMAG